MLQQLPLSQCHGKTIHRIEYLSDDRLIIRFRDDTCTYLCIDVSSEFGPKLDEHCCLETHLAIYVDKVSRDKCLDLGIITSQERRSLGS